MQGRKPLTDLQSGYGSSPKPVMAANGCYDIYNYLQ